MKFFLLCVCRKILILLFMEKVAIGEVSRGGGFPRLVRRVEEDGEPIIIMKKNESVAIILPCPDEMEQYLSQYYGMIATLRSLARDSDDEARMFLAIQAAIGDAAKVFLSAVGVDLSELQSESNEILSQMGSLVRTYAFQKNSSEEGGSVSPMTTARADVSEVKQEELPLGNSSLSRKSGKKSTKKEASSPQKRKIGTNGETSA